MTKVELLTLFLLLFSIALFSQEKQEAKDVSFKKNSIKAMVFALRRAPIYAVSYERMISKSSSINLIGYHISVESYGGKRPYFISELTYKYYIPIKNNYFKGIWASIGGIFTKELKFYINGWISQSYGLSVALGKNFYLSENKTWFFDIGIGLTMSKVYYKSIFCKTRTKYKPYPKPIFMFGRKF